MSEGKAASDPLKSFLSGGAGGMAAVATGHPLDLIKVLLQNQPVDKPLYTGTFDCAKQIVSRDGFFRGLYRGMSAPLVGVAPIFALSFFGNACGQQLVTKVTGHKKLNYAELFAGGMFAGVLSTVIMAPGERIKCLLQTDVKGQYKGMGDCAKQLHRNGGLKNLYRGTVLTLARDVPASGCYFAGYEFIKNQLTPEGQSLSISASLIAGGCAGMANWVVGIVPDTLKTRFQTDTVGKYSGVLHVYRDVTSESGFLALFRGITPVMLRAFPANAACFLAMELSMNGLNCLW